MTVVPPGVSDSDKQHVIELAHAQGITPDQIELIAQGTQEDPPKAQSNFASAGISGRI